MTTRLRRFADEYAVPFGLAVVAVFAVLWGAFLIAQDNAADDSKDRFNQWLARCVAEEGVVSPTHLQEDGRYWYECVQVADHKILDLPDYTP